MPIEQIVKQLQSERDRLDAAIKALTTVVGTNTLQPKRKRTLSASARRKISLAQKARWAKRASSGQAGTARPKRIMSASARRKIAAAQRARWAKLKKAKWQKGTTKKVPALRQHLDDGQLWILGKAKTVIGSLRIIGAPVLRRYASNSVKGGDQSWAILLKAWSTGFTRTSRI